jgi:3-oxoacyl-[acyl-carrier protein] reductase
MRCALITGGSRGIGRAISVQLAQDHQLHILVNYANNKEAALQTISLIEENGGTAELMPFDVKSSEEVSNSIESWYKNNPDSQIDVLVNNAGITRDNLFPWVNEKDWDDVLNTSVKGMYNCSQAVSTKMLRKRKGRIINIASLSGLKGVAGQTNYSAAKGAMIAFTKALAQEFGKRKITVNAIAPGFISSDMTAAMDEESLKKMVPANRFGTVEEVAHLASFLASDKASYITGEVININGGLYS